MSRRVLLLLVDPLSTSSQFIDCNVRKVHKWWFSRFAGGSLCGHTNKNWFWVSFHVCDDKFSLFSRQNLIMHRINFTSAAAFNANLFHSSLNSPKKKSNLKFKSNFYSLPINKSDLENSRAGLIWLRLALFLAKSWCLSKIVINYDENIIVMWSDIWRNEEIDSDM